MKKTTMYKLVLVFPLFFSLFPPTFTAKSPGKLNQAEMVAVIAHRGASGYAPENTIASFDKAVEMKADYIEMDVQRSKDGKLIIIHDRKVDRTTDGTGYVKDLTFKQLESLDAGNWKGKEFTGEKIPPFEEVLKRYKGKIGILIELKYPEIYSGIEEQVVQSLKKLNLDQPRNEEIIIQSFNHNSMKKMNKLLPEVPIGILTTNKDHTTTQALKDFASYVDYFNPNIKILNEDLVNQAYAYGMKVFPWTVRSYETAQMVSDMNVTAIITDYPEYIE